MACGKGGQGTFGYCDFWHLLLQFQVLKLTCSVLPFQITAKGKGAMTTYWVNVPSSQSVTTRSIMSESVLSSQSSVAHMVQKLKTSEHPSVAQSDIDV